MVSVFTRLRDHLAHDSLRGAQKVIISTGHIRALIVSA
jgi:hypothetical protein